MYLVTGASIVRQSRTVRSASVRSVPRRPARLSSSSDTSMPARPHHATSEPSAQSNSRRSVTRPQIASQLGSMLVPKWSSGIVLS